KKIVVSADGKKLLSCVLIGDAQDYGNMLQYKLNGIDLHEYPDALILPQRDGAASPGLRVSALPGSAQICSCNNVSNADLLQAIDGGVTTRGELKSCTTAGTSCGRCSALVGQILNCELESRGLEVNRDLCEHFAYIRQDLYMMV